MEPALLKYHVLKFIQEKEKEPAPLILFPGLKNILPITQKFKENLTDQTTLKELCQYCLSFKNYLLGEALIDFLLELNPKSIHYHFFKATILFLTHQFDNSLKEIEICLNLMNVQPHYIDRIIQELKRPSIIHYFFLFLPPVLEHYCLSVPTSEFTLFLFPYPMQNAGQPIKQRYSYYLNDCCNRLQEHYKDMLTAILNEEYKINGESTWYHMSMGKLQWLLHDQERADFHFKRCKELSNKTLIYFDNDDCGVYSWLTQKTLQENLKENQQRDHFHLSEWKWFYADLNNQSADLLIIIGCDQNYFKFFPKFLFTLIQAHQRNHYQDKTVVAIAIDNSTAEQIQFLQNIVSFIHKHIPNLLITYGYGSSPYKNGAYFASIRFLFADMLYQRYPTQTFILDIDVQVPEDFFTVKLPHLTNYDFGLRLFAFDQDGNQLAGAPWCIGAGIMYLNNIKIATELLSFISTYLQYAYDPTNHTNWCIDQCALAQAFEQFIRPHWNKLKIRGVDQDQIFILANDFKTKNDFYHHDPFITNHNLEESIKKLLL